MHHTQSGHPGESPSAAFPPICRPFIPPRPVAPGFSRFFHKSYSHTAYFMTADTIETLLRLARHAAEMLPN